MDDHLDIELQYTNLQPPLCWERIFGNTAPVEIEIGFGKCGFLLAIADQQPTLNFVGIESSRKYYRKGVKKFQRTGLKNIKLIWGGAFHILKKYVLDVSIAQVYINFPDPWPKKRHAKRRLLNAEFVSLLAQKLCPRGYVDIATDVEWYSNVIQEIFRLDDLYKMMYYQTSSQSESARQYVSDYELLFLKDGKKIHYLKYQKT